MHLNCSAQCSLVAIALVMFKLAPTALSLVRSNYYNRITGSVNGTLIANWAPCLSVIQCVASCEFVVNATVTSSECELALFNVENGSCSLYTDVGRSTNESDVLTKAYAKRSGLCAVGWTYSSGSCYIAVNGNATWNDAEVLCNAFGATLTSVTDVTEHDVILGVREDITQHYWIGGRRTDNGTDFVWNWTDGEEWSFTNFAPDQPSDFDSVKCLAVNSITTTPGKRNLWNDRQCGLLYPCICEKAANT